jgi:diguanylate cyclase (GGDEF)-like protein
MLNPPAFLSHADLDRMIAAVSRLPKSSGEDVSLGHLIYIEQARWAQLFESCHVEAGEVMFFEDDPGESAYTIKSGKLAIVKGDLSAPVVLGCRRRGETIGEMALLDGAPRSATAVALENSLLMEINRENFFVLLKRSRRFTENILHLLSIRLREASDALESATLEKIQDPLTELYNRRYMESMLSHELQRANHAGYPVSLIMIDIDHFKQLNDTYGHPAGDAVLRRLASLMKSQIRRADIACRYGGEEFVIILPETKLVVAAERAETLCKVFAEMVIAHGGQEMRSQLSLGVAAYPLNAQTSQELIQIADRALYAAKVGGRNRVVVAGSEELL